MTATQAFGTALDCNYSLCMGKFRELRLSSKLGLSILISRQYPVGWMQFRDRMAPLEEGRIKNFLTFFIYQAPQNTRLELKPAFWAKSRFKEGRIKNWFVFYSCQTPYSSSNPVRLAFRSIEKSARTEVYRLGKKQAALAAKSWCTIHQIHVHRRASLAALAILHLATLDQTPKLARCR